MQAKFQGILFHVEKIEYMPGYFLSKHGKIYGSVNLELGRFYLSVGDLKEDVSGKDVLAFNFDISDFQLLNYDIVTSEWLCEQMDAQQITVEDIASYAGTSHATVYRWRTSIIPNQSKAILFSLFNK